MSSAPGRRGRRESGQGAGVGLRYETGIGPLRADIALPIGGSGDGYALYIGIGQAF